MNIVTVCRAGLVRSVALSDVLKLHFEPMPNVLALGFDFSDNELKEMLFDWANLIVAMDEHFYRRIRQFLAERSAMRFCQTVALCDVGPDTYGTPKHPVLISKCFNWARTEGLKFNLVEHHKSL